MKLAGRQLEEQNAIMRAAGHQLQIENQKHTKVNLQFLNEIEELKSQLNNLDSLKSYLISFLII